MKTTITRTSLLTLALILSFTVLSYAQYYQVYLCDDATVTLRMPEENTLAVGDKVYWFKDGNAVPEATFTFSAANSTNLTIPGTLGVGLHKYTTAIESLGGCLGPQSEPFDIYKLPTKTLALTKDRATYCGADSGPFSGSVITATTTPAAALPDGIEYEYDWSVTKGGVAYTPISDIGASDGSKTAINIFNMSVKDAGTYVFNAKVRYKLTATNTGVFKSGDTKGCEVTASATQQVIVTPKPTKPTISLVN